MINGGFNYTPVYVSAAERLGQGCFIGTDAPGTTAVPNDQRAVFGVRFSGAAILDRRRPDARRSESHRGHHGAGISCPTTSPTARSKATSSEPTPREPPRSAQLPDTASRSAPAAPGTVHPRQRHRRRRRSERHCRSATPPDSTSRTITRRATSSAPTSPARSTWATRRGHRTSGRPTSPSAAPAPARATSSRSTGARGLLRIRTAPTSHVRVPDPRQLDLRQPPASGFRRNAWGSTSEASLRLRAHIQRSRRRRRRSRTQLQNFPIITSAVSSLVGGGTTHHREGSTARANTTYTLDFYSNPACVDRPQDFLEGRTYLGSDAGHDRRQRQRGDQCRSCPSSIEPGEKVTATATDPDGNTSEFSQRLVLRSTPGSGPRRVAGVTLDGFHFLSGATVTVGGVAGDERQRRRATTITTITTPRFRPAALNDVTLTNTDGTAGTLPNGWIADFLDVPGGHIFYQFVTTLVRNEITVGVGGGIYGVNAEHPAPADGGLPAEGEVRHLLRAAALHRAGLPRRALLLALRAVDQRTRRGGHHRRLRRRQLLSHQPRQPPADGGLSPEGLRRQRLHPARLHRGDVHGRAVLAPVRSPGSTSSSPATSPPAAAAATTARGTSANRGQIATFIVEDVWPSVIIRARWHDSSTAEATLGFGPRSARRCLLPGFCLRWSARSSVIRRRDSPAPG